ncbi:MAG: RecQ family zinc-binding domain-containing protein, partial [Candidatus Firestonebacteria bacterium]|nr:RecQ family zinc-binding domain-containing protein [Candidatus Firestonebacteria bacterium]
RKIIHYDLPKSIENYSQEIGRAGRDGENSLCEVLADRGNVNILENFIYGDTPEEANIVKLLQIIKENNSKNWEVKIIKLSNEIDIRLLPLKTLLVYLEMGNIIKPKYIYFEEYSFKYITTAEDIINRFDEERKKFVQNIFINSKTAKIWTTVNITQIMKTYRTTRDRIIKALEYFEEKGWIELEAANNVDVYEIIDNNFNISNIAEKIYKIFKEKEAHHIHRIHEMISFFETETCINQKLADYFGEKINKSCGHCSLCNGEKTKIEYTAKLFPLAKYRFNEVTLDLFNTLGKEISDVAITKYLCGINSPVFIKNRLTKNETFGIFENYRFHDVKKWVNEKII